MEIGSFLIVFFMVRYIRTSLQTAERFPEWDRMLLMVQYVATGLLVSDIFLDSDFTKWVWHLLLIGMVGAAYLLKDFRPVRNVWLAVGPFILISLFGDLVELIVPDFYESIKTMVEIAEMFSFIWMVATWFITRKQQKALEKERLKRQQEEEQNRIIASQNVMLEQIVAERTAELTRQKEELEQTLTELKATQDQLIQREKMASLGELTAGIAHEIQNPLNFVNNFSEVSVELIEELKEERQKTDRDAGLEEEILADLAQNLQKINHHGKRADSIVKGMLQHSRASTHEREPIDINNLADEYLRLAYHGLRANDKSFNATLLTDFDSNLGKVSVVPQDMGRVLLNLFTNAFYATEEKRKTGLANYQPTVQVITRRIDGETIELRVRDNGCGIPASVLNKIYQPFFTTKPTGQGTGLGLSLSYDIITKGHGGELVVETEEGKFTEFTIRLPT
ncbi:phospho-acceptor domain-containing protein [Larkinella arboricola]|uniref:histidine kinase n=1 Tax=Larkinella arboricola TaxID=643671 RepID=A0A327XA08_LARAB|nr:ATP-binding protein [Larkinella arboricola]RAK02462.1 phospho-acceptor domain-containing protein [Larkinella arboricola]